jgi:hypothetical protein
MVKNKQSYQIQLAAGSSLGELKILFSKTFSDINGPKKPGKRSGFHKNI